MTEKYINGLTERNCTDPQGLATRLGYIFNPLAEADALVQDDPALTEHCAQLRAAGYTHLAAGPTGTATPAKL